MSVAPVNSNGESKALTRLTAFWPIIVATVLVTYTLATSIGSIAATNKQVETNTALFLSMQGKVNYLEVQTAAAVAERNEIKDRVYKLQDLFATLAAREESADAKFREQMIEVETQIDSMAQSLGIQFATTQRTMGGIENALHDLGATFPLPPVGPWYFPNISNRSSGAAKTK